MNVARRLVDRLIRETHDRGGEATGQDGNVPARSVNGALTPARAAEAVRQYLGQGASKIVIQPNMGTSKFQVAEVWAQDGAIHISIEPFNPAGNLAAPAGEPA